MRLSLSQWHYGFYLLLIMSIYSCKKFVEVSPPVTQIAAQTVFSSDATAIAAMNGIYSRLLIDGGFASGDRNSITILCGLSADELRSHELYGESLDFFNNNLTANSSVTTYQFWSYMYNTIYSANALLEGLANSEVISDSVKLQLTGEAKFMRAFCHFYLASLFGRVPIALTTDYTSNVATKQSSTTEVYDIVIQDLLAASQSLPTKYAAVDERVRPVSWVAKALLAKTYLYAGSWEKAESFASELIDHSELFYLLSDLNEIFKANSAESIWQLKPNDPRYNTNEGKNFILTETPRFVSLTNEQVNCYEGGDVRKTHWVGKVSADGIDYYYPYKYKQNLGTNLTEYSMVFRLAEQYLIRAEARNNQLNFEGAAMDINTIRNRAELPNTTAADFPSLKIAVEQERRAELFTEWGNRWMDLKRTGRATAILEPQKGILWQATDTLYPIPSIQIINSSNTIQNPGY